jgi:hypothetical protein
MPKKVKVEKSWVYTCDFCGFNEEIKAGEKNEWVSLIESKADGMRLIEKVQETPRYESFHVPNKKILHYCTKKCARQYLLNSIELLLAEISPQHIKPQNRGLDSL